MESITALRYRLCAAIHHRGCKDKGHYVSVARTPGGQLVRHDKERVTLVSLEEALHPGAKFTPYLLFWRNEKLELCKRSLPDDGDEDTPSRMSRERPRTGEMDDNATASGRWPTLWFFPISGRATKPQQISEKLFEYEREKAELNRDV